MQHSESALFLFSKEGCSSLLLLTDQWQEPQSITPLYPFSPSFTFPFSPSPPSSMPLLPSLLSLSLSPKPSSLFLSPSHPLSIPLPLAPHLLCLSSLPFSLYPSPLALLSLSLSPLSPSLLSLLPPSFSPHCGAVARTWIGTNPVRAETHPVVLIQRERHMGLTVSDQIRNVFSTTDVS